MISRQKLIEQLLDIIEAERHDDQYIRGLLRVIRILRDKNNPSKTEECDQ